MNKQPIFQGPYWRRYSNATATNLSDTAHSRVGLGRTPCSLRLESNNLAMGTLTYKVLSNPLASFVEQHDVDPASGGAFDLFSTVTSVSLTPGTRVRITASPTSTRYVWDHFENAAGQRLDSNTGQIDLTINQTTTVRAIFRERNEQQYVTLNVSYDHAQGTVTATPALINDSVTVNVGHAVVLTATPKTGYEFKQWRNVLNGGGTNHTVTTEPVHTERMVTGNKTIYADFVKISNPGGNPPGGQTTKTVTVKCDGTMGRVTCTSQVSPIKNGFIVTAPTGDTVTIKATPNSSTHFVKWSGGPVDGRTEDQVTFAVNGNYTIYAIFAANSEDPGDNPGSGGGGGGGGNNPVDPGTPGIDPSTSTGKVMAFVKKWWWALLIAAYLIYDATKGGRK